MLINATSPRFSEIIAPVQTMFSVQSWGNTTSGAGTAQIKMWGSNVKETTVPWVLIATIDLTLGTTVVGDGTVFEAPWNFMRAELVSITGTGASVSVVSNGR